MATFNETITLENPGDIVLERHGVIRRDEIRRITTDAVVDSGAWTLVISPEMQQKLGLQKVSDSSSEVAGGEEKSGWDTEPVMIYWKDRHIAVQAFVLPGQQDILLGAYPLEGMDLMLDMKGERLVGKHGAKPLYRV
jgi:clan AA aspartic protease